MPAYVFLLAPSTNRVYAESAVALTLAELAVLNDRLLGGKLADLGEAPIGGVRYLGFTAPPLEERDVRVLSLLSSIYALFERVGELLRPVELRPLARFDDDLLTIQKYPGKTNEQFTRLLLNVTVAATAFAAELPDKKLRVLDPTCGRGTTLLQALMYGWDAAGLEIDDRDVAAFEQFIGTYLKRKRLKHELRAGPVRDAGKVIGRRFDAEIGATKEAYKAGVSQHLSVVTGDTTRIREHWKPGSFDAVVADLPYGVQHGSQAQGLSRRPMDLLGAALPGWAALLRPGGAIGLSWNRHVAGREKLVELLTAQGLEVQEAAAYQGFRHVVDQSITRDLIVARR